MKKILSIFIIMAVLTGIVIAEEKKEPVNKSASELTQKTQFYSSVGKTEPVANALISDKTDVLSPPHLGPDGQSGSIFVGIDDIKLPDPNDTI